MYSAKSLFEELFHSLWQFWLGLCKETPRVTASVVYYANPISVPKQNLREWTSRVHKQNSFGFDDLVYSLFLTARAFYFDLAQLSQNCSVPVNLTLRLSYVRCNNFFQDVSINGQYSFPFCLVGLTYLYNIILCHFILTFIFLWRIDGCPLLLKSFRKVYLCLQVDYRAIVYSFYYV